MRHPLSTKKIILGVCLIATGITAGYFIKASLNQLDARNRFVDGRLIPASGLLVNPHGLDGLTHESEDHFRRLSKALQGFVRAKGVLPRDFNDLYAFTAGGPDSDRVTAATLRSADSLKEDRYDPVRDKGESGSTYKWSLWAERADGSSRPARPKPGERDVWVQTDEFFRSGHTVFRDQTQTNLPRGYLLVIWSDGKVEKLPPSAERMVHTPSGESTFCLGEPGVAENAPLASHVSVAKSLWGPAPAIGLRAAAANMSRQHP